DQGRTGRRSKLSSLIHRGGRGGRGELRRRMLEGVDQSREYLVVVTIEQPCPMSATFYAVSLFLAVFGYSNRADVRFEQLTYQGWVCRIMQDNDVMRVVQIESKLAPS